MIDDKEIHAVAVAFVWLVGAVAIGIGYAILEGVSWALANTAVAVDLAGWTAAIVGVPLLAGGVVLAGFWWVVVDD